MIPCLAALVLGAGGPVGPVTLAYREQPGTKLVYMTTLTYTVKLPESVQAELPGGPGAKNQAIFYSTTFVTHQKRQGNDLVSDVRTWSEDTEAEGWLANVENQPQGPRNGGGTMKRDSRGRFTLIPKTTDFAPEFPVPTFPSRAVRPGESWSTSVVFEGKIQSVTHKLESWEDRGGVSCARIEMTGLTFSGLPLSAPMVAWVDPRTGRTVRTEAIFRKSEKGTMANIFFVRTLAKVEESPQPTPVAPGVPTLKGRLPGVGG